MSYTLEQLSDVYGWLVQFVQDWGYIAVFLGSLIEGESIIFLAGFFAHEGYLSLPKIILISFFGSLIADQSLYHVGRHYGNHIIDKFPSMRLRADRAFRLLRRYDNIYILTFRFIYGIRIISPIIIGASGVEFKRFSILNIIAAAIWSVGSCVAAYYFAYLVMDKFHLFPKILLGVLLGGGILYYLISKLRKRRT